MVEYPMTSDIERGEGGWWITTTVHWTYRYPTELMSSLETRPFYGWIHSDPLKVLDLPDEEWTMLKAHQWAVAMAENHNVKSGNGCQLSDILEAYLHLQGVDNWSFLGLLHVMHVNPSILGVLRALPM